LRNGRRSGADCSAENLFELGAVEGGCAGLAAERAESNALEAEILRDVRSRAAKLALQHHFTLVLASPEADRMMLLPAAASFTVPRYAPIISNTARDVTDEMVREMQSIEAVARK